MGKPLYKPAIYQRQLKFWTPERIAKWERTRERGAFRFFAVCMGAMLGGTLVFMIGVSLYVERSVSIVPLGAGMAVAFLASFFFTWNIWRSNETLYTMAVEMATQKDSTAAQQ